MFGKLKIDKDMINLINPTSKLALKKQCLIISNGDIDKAERIYSFMIKDMEELPLYDIPEPTKLQQTKDIVANGWKWINDNKDNVASWINLIKGITSKSGNNTPIPPINQ